jgi:hypothetical protein
MDFWIIPDFISICSIAIIFLSVLLFPIVILWWLVLIFNNKSNNILRISLSIYTGLYFSFFFTHRQFTNYSEDLWNRTGIVVESAIKKFQETNGYLPKTIEEIPDSLFINYNWLVHKYCSEISIKLKGESQFEYYYNDSVDYELNHYKNWLDYYYWDSKRKEWVYWD